MKKNLAIFYQNLKDRGNEIPYISTLAFFALSIGLHMFHFILLFDIPKYIYSPIKLENVAATRWVNAIILATPIFVFSFFSFKKSFFEEYNFTSLDLEKGYKKHVAYIFLSILFLIILLILKGKK
jgi:hypothetical protein